LSGRLAQRRGFREYLAGLLAPRERNKTLAALAGAGPAAGAQHAAVQRLRFFLPESRWDPERVSARRLELLAAVWAGGRLYYPVRAVPCSPARHFAEGKNDPAFAAKLAIGADLAVRARDAGFAFRAVTADCACGGQDGFRGELAQAGLPFVMALKPRRGTWAYGADAHTPVDAARELAWGGPEDPGAW
jgi:SRSO17 transposase